VWITNLADGGPGSLRAAATAPGAAWIRFAVSGTIQLSKDLDVAADKTIDGRGAAVTIAGEGMRLGSSNVILENLRFALGAVPGHTEDDVLIDGADDVWIDHCSFTGGADKLIGAPAGGDITVSWNHFYDHDQAVQLGAFGARAESGALRVTLHHNYFDNTGYRNPRVSYGIAHAFNNYLRNWGEHGMSSVRGAQLVSEGNVFEAGSDKDAIIVSRGKRIKDHFPGDVRSIHDLLLNGAKIDARQDISLFDPHAAYPYVAQPATLLLRGQIAAGAGWQPFSVGTSATAPSETSPPAAVPAGPDAPSTIVPGPMATTHARPGAARPADEDDGAALLVRVVALLAVGAVILLLLRRATRRPTEGNAP
jgi:pectate lyase